MNEFQTTSLVLLGVALIDATGDAFRVHRWQIVHHLMEVLGIATFFLIWALFEFRWEYIPVYITGRIVVFDPVFNLIAGNPINYVGESSFYGRIMTWVAKLTKEPGHLIWVIRAMALTFWLTWLLTK